MQERGSLAHVPAARPEPKTPKGAATRQRIIRAARAELVERDGMLEVDSVATRAQVSVGALYRHFGSRAALVGAVVDDFYQRYRGRRWRSTRRRARASPSASGAAPS